MIAAIVDSPKPPPQRITMTLPLINAAARVAFTVAGGSKAAAIKKILATSYTTAGPHIDLLPAGLIQPTNGELRWFIDLEAAEDTGLNASVSVQVSAEG